MRKAWSEAGRSDLIGGGCDALIPSVPPPEALKARREAANDAVRRDHYHAVANPAKGEAVGERGLPNSGQKKGYRPGRKSAQRWKKGRGTPPIS